MRRKQIFLSLFIVTLFIQSCIYISKGQNQPSKIVRADLTKVESDVLKEMNHARTNPKAYAKKLKRILSYYDGNLLKYPGRIPLRTKEGPGAVKEAIEYLENVEAVGPLKSSKGMSRAAMDLVKDQGPKGSVGHTGSDGSSPFDRINRYGKWLVTAGENISYGQNTGEDIVIQLIIDDGVPSRGHRKNIFNGSFKVAGIAFGSHKRYRAMCVIDYAGGYREK